MFRGKWKKNVFREVYFNTLEISFVHWQNSVSL